jgi:hypothetical protein
MAQRPATQDSDRDVQLCAGDCDPAFVLEDMSLKLGEIRLCSLTRRACVAKDRTAAYATFRSRRGGPTPHLGDVLERSDEQT